MVDLRKEFDGIIKEFGRHYLLVRNDKTQRCSCVDTLYNTAKDKCPICLGTGYINSVEKLAGRDTVAAVPETLPRMITNTEIGNMAVPSRRFYFYYDTMPKRQDLVIVCGWNGNKPIIDEYTEIYEINHVEPKRADNGRIEYFIASSSNNPINASAKLHNMITNANRVTYYVTVRRR